MNHIANNLLKPQRKGWMKKPLAKERICDLEDYNLFCSARRISEIICAYADNQNPKAPHTVNPVQDTPNPYFYQVASGLFLELLDGKPSTLWTPWGTWYFVNATNDRWLKVMPDILKRLGAVEYQPAYSPHCGPVYALHRIDDHQLPEPMELERAAWESYIGIMSVWKELINRYRCSKK